MSFLSRFTHVMAGKPVTGKTQPRTISAPVAKVDDSKARELILEAKEQVQRILSEAQSLKAQAAGRLSALEQREKTVAGQEHRWQQQLRQIEDTKQQQLKK